MYFQMTNVLSSVLSNPQFWDFDMQSICFPEIVFTVSYHRLNLIIASGSAL